MNLPNRALMIGGALLAAMPAFEPIQPDVLSATSALVNAFADYDGDDDLDLFVGMNGGANRLYRNDRGRFTDVAAAAGVADARPTRAAAWADADADGDPDLLVGFAPGPSTGPGAATGSVLRLYRNVKGVFTDATASSGLSVEAGAVRQPVFVDVDADGDLDLFVAFRDRANAYFRNDGGRFVEIAAQIGLADTRRSVGAVWFDFDEDGDLDVAVGEMDGDPNALYRNDGGRFTDAADDAGVAWGGRVPREAANGTVRPCAGDVNNDGRLDLFFANYGRNGLFLNRGSSRFQDVSAAWGVAVDGRYDTCAFSDVDNDGRLDLYVNGTVTGGTSYPDFLFAGNGRRFAERTPRNLKALDADHGAQWADVDGDGDEDLALTGAGKAPMPLLFRNQLAAADARRSIRVRVLDRRGRATMAGAEVRAYGAGTRNLIGTRLVDAGSGYNSQNDMPIHLGWTGDSRVDIEVIWPARGGRIKEVIRNHDPARSRRTITVRVGRGA
jgi:FG-GAP-like repeat/ASPIC and UnbV